MLKLHMVPWRRAKEVIEVSWLGIGSPVKVLDRRIKAIECEVIDDRVGVSI
jgi:hypothetical protein